MITGSSGACIEVCGDGKNFGNEMCDDGNLDDGDGCSSTCEVEPDYQCGGGYPYKRDTCQYIRTEIVEVKINQHNDLILKFSRPIQSRDGTISERDFVLSYRN
jgi:cysteine-rich repeat protein